MSKQLQNLKKSLRVIIIAAVLTAAAVVVLLLLLNDSDRIVLERSTGNIRVRYVSEVPEQSAMMNIAPRPEYYFFEHENTPYIFYGTVKEIRFIETDYSRTEYEYYSSFDGVNKGYYIIAKIEVKEVFRGELNVGDVITTMTGNKYFSGYEMIPLFKEAGVSGIFMPIKFGEDEYWEAYDIRLYMRDFADFGLWETYMFVEKEAGVAFYYWDFPSLHKNSAMDDVRELVNFYVNGKPNRFGEFWFPHTAGSITVSNVCPTIHPETLAHPPRRILCREEALYYATDIINGFAASWVNISIEAGDEISYMARIQVRERNFIDNEVILGDIFTVLVPVPLGAAPYDDLVYKLHNGSTFALKKLNDNYYWEHNGDKMFYSEIASYIYLYHSNSRLELP
jgi:hypothetical protein